MNLRVPGPGPVEPQWLGVVLLVIALLGMLALLRWARTRFALHPEVTRKLAHVGLGLAALSYPWLFATQTPVLVLGVLSITTLLALRYLPALRGPMSGVVHGVERRSGGDLYFPLAATATYLVAEWRGEWVLYVVPILTLTLADAIAALIGVFYGRVRFTGADGVKSLEGSLAFLVVAFLAAHVPLLLLTGTGRAESLLIGLIFGVLTMLLEAVAWRGLDNLFLPVGGLLLLQDFLGRSASELAARLAGALLLAGLLLALRHRRTLNDAALLAAVLVGYAIWTLADWRWLVPPLALFVGYAAAWPRRMQQAERPHDVRAVLAVTLCGVAWLLGRWASRELGLAVGLEDDASLFAAYTVTFAATLAFIGITWWRDFRRDRRPVAGGVVAVLVALAVVIAPALLLAPAAVQPLADVAVAATALGIGAAAFVLVIPHRPRGRSHDFWWTRQSLLAFGTGAVALLLDGWMRTR